MNLIPYPKYKLIDETILDTEWLFSHSMKQNINRADILVRMLAIGPAFDLYLADFE